MVARCSLALAGLLLSYLAGPSVAAVTEDVSARRCSAALQNVTLAEAAEVLSKAGGITIRVDRAVRKERITIECQGLPVRAALDLIAELAGLQVEPLKDGTGYQLSRRRGAAPPSATDDGGGWFGPLNRDKVRKIRLDCRFVAPSTIASYFGRPSIRTEDSGLVLEMPKAVTPPCYHAWMPGADQALAARQATLAPEVDSRLKQRWSPDGQALKADLAQPLLRVPDEVAAMIGFDAAKALILVGQPAATEAFRNTVVQYDVPPAAARIETRLLALSPEQVQRLTLNWRESQALSGNGTLAYATCDEAALAGLGSAAAGPTLTCDNGQPVILSLSRLMLPAPGTGGCEGVPADMAQDVTAVAVTADVKLVTWLTGANGQTQASMLVDPIYGDVVVEMAKRTPPAIARLASAVPPVTSLVQAPAGQTILLRAVSPVGDFRARDACPLLGALPLIGQVYQTGPTPAGAATYLVALTVRPAGH